MNLNAENKVLKKDLVTVDQDLFEVKKELEIMTEMKLDLDGQVMKLTAKKEEDDHTIEVLNSKI